MHDVYSGVESKDLEAVGHLYHVGARFEALSKGILMAASDFSCNFFPPRYARLESAFNMSNSTDGPGTKHTRNNEGGHSSRLKKLEDLSRTYGKVFDWFEIG